MHFAHGSFSGYYRTMGQFRKIYLILAFSGLGSGLFAAAPPLLEWQKCLGGSGQDMPVKVVHSQYGYYLILGSTGSVNGDVTFNHGSNDIWLTCLDTNGVLLWQKSFGGSSMDVGTGLAELSNGDLMIGGYTASSDGDISSSHGNFDAWLIRTDASGNLQWEKTYGGSQVDLCYSMIHTMDGGVLMGGGSYSNDGDVSGNHGDQDFWLIKTDASGNVMWQRSLGGTGLDVCQSLAENSSGELVAAGSTTSSDGDVSFNHGMNDFWVVKLDSNGTVLWKKCYGGSNNESALSISTSSNGYLVGGYSSSSDGDLNGNQGYNDYWILRIDENGTLLYQKNFGGSGSDISYTSVPVPSGGFILCGGSTSGDGDISSTHGMEDVWLVKTDSLLNIEWTKTYGGSNNDRPSCILPCYDGGFLVSGYSYSNDGDVSGNHGTADFWILRLSCKVPQAFFSTTGTTYCSGSNTQFQNQSVQSAAYTWTVNGVVFSHDVNPTFQFPAAGSYLVSLTSETCYDSSQTVLSLTANSFTQPVISSTDSVLCGNDSVTLTAGPGNTFLWTNGETTMQITVSQPGTYGVTVTQGGCTGAALPINLTHHSIPDAGLGNDTTICAGTSMYLQAVNGMGSYTWQDGSHLNYFLVSQPGYYSVMVTAYGCSSTDSVLVDTVTCTPPQAGFTCTSQGVCAGGSVNFTDASVAATGWQWSFPGGTPSSSTVPNPVISYSAPGQYSVLLTVTNATGSQNLMRYNFITVNANPAQPVITVTGNQLLSSLAESYQWICNTASIQGAAQQNYTATQDGYYQVTISDANGCTATSDSVHVLIMTAGRETTVLRPMAYPNPSHGKVTVRYTCNSPGAGKIILTDLNGRILEIMNTEVSLGANENSLDLSAIPSGVYQAEIITAESIYHINIQKQ